MKVTSYAERLQVARRNATAAHPPETICKSVQGHEAYTYQCRTMPCVLKQVSQNHQFPHNEATNFIPRIGKGAPPKPSPRPMPTSGIQAAFEDLEQAPVSSSVFDNIEEAFRIVEDAKPTIVFDAKHSNVVLVVGNTGTGKSTLLQFIAGDNSKLTAVEYPPMSGNFIIQDKDDRISTSDEQMDSKTLFPELIVNQTGDMAFYDCPGFKNTRGTAIDMASSYLTKMVFDRVDSLKVLICVEFDTAIGIIGRAASFVEAILHVGEFIKDASKFDSVFSLAVTKVPKLTREENGKEVLIEDKTVIASIGEFIINSMIPIVTYRITKECRSNEKKILENALIIFKALSTQNNGVYNKIGLFRKPQRAGALDKSKLMQDSRAGIINAIKKETKFVVATRNDFGYTVDNTTKMQIVSMGTELNENLNSLLTNIGNAVGAALKERMRTSQDWLQLQEYLGSVKNILTREAEILKELRKLTAQNITVFQNAIKETGLSISGTMFMTMKKNASYLEFLESMIDDNMQTVPKAALDETIKLVEQAREWYKTLFNVYEALSKDSIQADTTKFNVATLDDWGRSGMEQGIRIAAANFDQFFKLIKIDREQLGDLELDEIRMNELNRVTNLTLIQKESMQVGLSGTLLANGPFIRMSKVMEKYKENPEAVKSFQIFASCVVYIDVDFETPGRNMVIVAPTWNVTSQFTLNLDGTAGIDKEGSAAAGIGLTVGENGLPGGSGKSAGNFLGLAEIIVNPQFLTVTANGGRGGNGQAGGDGGNGTDGIDGPVPSDWLQKTPFGLENTDWNFIARKVFERSFYHEHEYQYNIFPKAMATDGMDGGDGGVGGFPGSKGEIILIIFSGTGAEAPTVRNIDGTMGQDGAGGQGGNNGRHGDNILGIRWKHSDAMNLIDYRGGWENRGVYKRNGYSNRGARGKDGRNAAGQEAATKSDPPSALAYSLNEYKAITIAFMATNPLRRAVLKVFLEAFDQSDAVKNLYNIKAYMNEMDTLESQFYSVYRYIETRPYYESLLTRITKYSDSHKDQTTKVQRIVLGTIYSSCLSKVCSLKMETKAHTLVVDLQSYMGLTINRISELVTMDRRLAVKEFQASYKADIDLKLKEANGLIDSKITPAINKMIKNIDERLEKLVDETFARQEAAEITKDELIAAQRQMEKTIFILWDLSILKLGAIVASFCGPIGTALSGVVTAGSTIGESFVTQPDVAGTALLLPPGVKETVKGLGDLVAAVREKRIASLEAQMKFVADEIAATLPEERIDLQDVDGKLQHVKGKLEEEKQKPVPADNEDEVAKQVMDVETIEKELRDKLKQKLAALQQDIDAGKEQNQNILDGMKRIDRGISVIQSGIDVYNKFKGEKKKLDVLSAAMREDENIMALKQYEGVIYNSLFPMVRNMREDVKAVTNSLSAKSQVALDVKKWGVRSSLNAVRKTMETAMKGFKAEAEVSFLFDQLNEALSLLMHIYDRLENFHDQQKLGDYIANVGAPGEYTDILRNTEYEDGITALNMTIRSNLILLHFDNAMGAFKQWVFPFARTYLEGSTLPDSLKPVKDTLTLEDLVANANKRLKEAKDNITAYWSSIQFQDQFFFEGKFYSNEKIGGPFYRWPHSQNREAINSLFRGREITLYADVREAAQYNGERKAIKFAKVFIRFTFHGKEDLKEKFYDTLEYFVVNLIHNGTSYYDFQDDIYVIPGDPLTLSYGVRGASTGDPDIKAVSRNKILTGDLLLSPYTLWTIQLSADKKEAFNLIKKFIPYVSLELEGVGKFIYDLKGQISALDLRPYDYYAVDGKL